MDPIAHALLGAALGKTRLGRRSPLAPFALVVGALAPELEILVGLVGGRDTWLRVHSGFTHSPVGLVLLALALVPFLRWLERELHGRHTFFSPSGSRRTCAPAVVVGLASHVPLDLLSDHGARPWFPLSDAWVRCDLLQPTDPWLWLLFGGTAALAGKRTPLGGVLLLLAALGGLMVIAEHPSSPGWLPWTFLGLGLALAWGRWRVDPRSRGRVLKSGALLLAVYLVGAGVLRGQAWDAAERALAQAGVEQPITALHPGFGDPTRWTAIALGREEAWIVELATGAGPTVERRARHLEKPLIQHALRLEESHPWRSSARHPIGRLTRLPDGAVEVELIDLRDLGRPWAGALVWRHRIGAVQARGIEAAYEASRR